MGPPHGVAKLTRSLASAGQQNGRNGVTNIYLFIELLGSADAGQILKTLKALPMDNCKFANVVALSEDKLVAQLDCKDSTDGDKAILNTTAKVEGVVQTNIVAVVRPRKG